MEEQTSSHQEGRQTGDFSKNYNVDEEEDEMDVPDEASSDLNSSIRPSHVNSVNITHQQKGSTGMVLTQTQTISTP